MSNQPPEGWEPSEELYRLTDFNPAADTPYRDLCWRIHLALEEARREGDELLGEVEKLRAERDELEALHDLQQTRMSEAIALWQEHSPDGRPGVLPDLGELLRWLMAERDEAEKWKRIMHRTD